MDFLLVGVGGAIGSMLRYAVSLIPFNDSFPVQTLITNIIGAIAIGFIFETTELRFLSLNTVTFLKTGVCGGFTTFSSFSLEAHNLISEGDTVSGVLYAVLSTALCILGIAMGIKLARLFFGR